MFSIAKQNRFRTLLIALALLAGLAVGGVAVSSFGEPELAGVHNVTPAPPQAAAGLATATELSAAFEQAVDRVSPSVVPIVSEQVRRVPAPWAGPDPFRDFFGDDFLRRFFGQRPGSPRGETVRGLGSGVIVSQDGYVLTNNHVVQGADKLTVLLGPHQRVPAEVVGTDPATDVAVIRLTGDSLPELPVAALGDSDAVRVGEWVIAVGNPFELLHTVTAGIISAKGRSSVGLADYEDFIQTDASINPGNSGGALADLEGRVIGINTAISSPTGGSVGIGFAIPINMARQVMESLIADGAVERGYLALMPQDIDADLAKALHLGTTDGALVSDVDPDGPAGKAGIRRGDVIVAFEGQEIHDSLELRQRVAQARPGSTVTVALRRDGKPETVRVALGKRPENAGAAERSGSGATPGGERLGMEVEPLTPDIARQLGTGATAGVVVTAVEPGGVAEEAGLRPGDVITEVDRTSVSSPAELERALARHGSGDSVAFLVRRGDGAAYLALQLP